MASLSTHVLDTARGRPAAGMTIELHVLRDGQRQHLSTVITKEDGRPGQPLAGNALGTGMYELTFHAAAYFRATSVELPSPPFLDEIVIRFGISEASSHYHVPLLLSPYGYSTYRGS
jgi:5-hydroxyisourate hydrolase